MGIEGNRVSQICTALRVAGSAVLLITAMSRDALAGSRLIEVRAAEKSYTGRVVAMNQSACVLYDRMGEMHRLELASLTGFERLSEQYRPFSVSEFRSQLMREFPKGYQLAGTSHYIVCGPAGKSQTYANLFEEVFRSVDSYYRVRGFRLNPPETPLVAIVFASQREFVQYCQRDGIPWTPGLRGYYSLRTNRIALFDDPALLSDLSPALRSAPELHRTQQRTALPPGPGGVLRTEDAYGQFGTYRLSGETAGTIVHETTHQVSYNIGIHSRAGLTPTWVLEGLATLLEAPGIRNTRTHQTVSARINQERLDWFRSKYSARRTHGDLARLIANDDMFRNSALDAYALAWAFTFFLAENPAHTKQFSTWLKTVSDRDPMDRYSAERRLQDFAAAFGDIAALEVEFLRFMDRL